MRAHAADTAEHAFAAMMLHLAPAMAASQVNAQRLDQDGGFPAEDLAALTAAGALAAVAPAPMGGLGIGTESARAASTAALLHAIGGGSISLGRVYEGHINAIRLVLRHGTETQRRSAAMDARAGQLHALWVTDGPEHGLHYTRAWGGIELHGAKHFCSAAGHASRAVVTATSPEGGQSLLLLPLRCGENVQALPSGMQGARSAGTGRVDFTGVRHGADVIIGAPDIYVAEPEFSAGAWRASAVAAGGLSALVEAARAELAARGRADHPAQRERLGRMLINAQTARLWLQHVAPIAEAADDHPAFAVATVNLGRIAIEAACLESLHLVQRSLGLAAFLRANKVERMCRDLATYLRQPAPDEALSEAAAYFAGRPPGMDFP